MVKNFYYVYILFSKKDLKLYTGFSSNLKNRFKEHQSGKVRSTKDRRPLELIHYEAFSDKRDAKAREVLLKSGFGRDQLKKALQNNLKDLKYEFLE
jgi:putative endonuclease